MKLMALIPTLTAVVFLYNVFTLPLQLTALSVLVALALYGMTHLTVSALAVFIAAAVYHHVVKARKHEGFNTGDGAEKVSQRVKEMRAKYEQTKPEPTGTLESPEVENFQNLVDPTKVEPEGESMGHPMVSVPAFVKEKGRLLVVPETSMPSSETVDRNPIQNPYVPKPDDESVHTALTDGFATETNSSNVQGLKNTAAPM